MKVMFDISIQNNKTPRRGNSKLAHINRKKRLSQAKLMFVNEPYPGCRRDGFGMYLLGNIFNERFKFEELISDRQVQIINKGNTYEKA